MARTTGKWRDRMKRLRSGYAQKSEKIIICAFGFEKNGRKSSFFRSGFHQIIHSRAMTSTFFVNQCYLYLMKLSNYNGNRMV